MKSTVVSSLSKPKSDVRIPKILFQTSGTSDLPEALARNVAELREMNPQWDYQFYDDRAVEGFIRREYGSTILRDYLKIRPVYGAARADLFRYLAIYRYGGVYLDIKSRFQRPIDEVLQGDESYVLSQWSNGPGERYAGFGLKPEVAEIPGGEFQQWHVIAAPGHPFLHAVLQGLFSGIGQYRPWLHGTGKAGVLRLTGPLHYTRTIAPLIKVYPCKVVRRESELSLDYSVVFGDTHRTLFKTHYTQHELPIVQLPPYLLPMELAHKSYRIIGQRRRDRA
jgi:hypothetical protein